MKKLLLITLAVVLSLSCLYLTGCADVFDGDYQDCTIEDLQAIVNSTEFQQGTHTIVLSNGYEVQQILNLNIDSDYATRWDVITKFAFLDGELKGYSHMDVKALKQNVSAKQDLWYSNKWIYKNDFNNMKVKAGPFDISDDTYYDVVLKPEGYSAHDLLGGILEMDQKDIYEFLVLAQIDNSITISTTTNTDTTKIKFFKENEFEAIFVYNAEYNLSSLKYCEWRNDNNETTIYTPYNGGISFPNDLDTYEDHSLDPVFFD